MSTRLPTISSELGTMLENARRYPQGIVHRDSNATQMMSNDQRYDGSAEDSSSDEVLDYVNVSALPTISRLSKYRASKNRHAYSTSEVSSTQSPCSSPGPSEVWSTTSSSICTADTVYMANIAGGRSSVSKWLRSTISRAASIPSSQRLPFEPSEFLTHPEQPQKHFVDSIGIACPGVSDPKQCASPVAHVVSTFRICQSIEYTTALADHGITYTDYCRLRIALKAFLVDQDLKTKMHSSQ
jgi:hypothetical protein